MLNQMLTMSFSIVKLFGFIKDKSCLVPWTLFKKLFSVVFKLFKAYFKSVSAWRLIQVVLVQFCLSYLFWGDSSC